MSLSADQRVAVIRAYYLGQTVADIAAHEHIPEGAVKSRLHNALRALRIALSASRPIDGDSLRRHQKQ